MLLRKKQYTYLWTGRTNVITQSSHTPTATAAEATNTQFIKFVDKTPRRQQENIQTELYHHLNKTDNKEEEDTPTDTHINLQIETTPAAMRIVMDHMARDNISRKRNRQPAYQLL